MDEVRDPSFEEVFDAVKPDSKNRISLGKAKVGHGVTHRILRNKSGQILLDPCVQVPVSEAWLYRNKKALKAVVTGIRQAEEGKTHEVGSFSEFADGRE